MKEKFITIISLMSILVPATNACSQNPEYQKKNDGWHQKREASLKSENGWLNLAGLSWLKKGKNTFGSSEKNQIQLPADTIDSDPGYFERTGNTVSIVLNRGVAINLNEKPIQGKTTVFDPDSEKPLVPSHRDLKWIIIKREDRVDIRLRNLKSSLLKSFHGIEQFPVDENWKIEARLISDNQPSEIPITNVLGQSTNEKSSGKLFFSINDQEYSLDVLDEDDSLFILFSDQTNLTV